MFIKLYFSWDYIANLGYSRFLYNLHVLNLSYISFYSRKIFNKTSYFNKKILYFLHIFTHVFMLNTNWFSWGKFTKHIIYVHFSFPWFSFFRVTSHQNYMSYFNKKNTLFPAHFHTRFYDEYKLIFLRKIY